MRKRAQTVSILIGLALILALAFSLLAFAEIKQVQIGVDGMI